MSAIFFHIGNVGKPHQTDPQSLVLYQGTTLVVQYRTQKRLSF